MATFTLEEGTFWGNVFTQEEDFNACRGADQAASETGGLENRDCTEPNPARPGTTVCGFQYAGECGRAGRRGACRGHDDETMSYAPVPRGRSFFEWEYWEEVTGLTGVALVAYLGCAL